VRQEEQEREREKERARERERQGCQIQQKGQIQHSKKAKKWPNVQTTLFLANSFKKAKWQPLGASE